MLVILLDLTIKIDIIHNTKITKIINIINTSLILYIIKNNIILNSNNTKIINIKNFIVKKSFIRKKNITLFKKNNYIDENIYIY